MSSFKEDFKRLQNRTTGDWMIIDPIDWDNVKEVFWFFVDGKVVNKSGQTYEDYVGINMKGRKHLRGVLNKLRESYGWK